MLGGTIITLIGLSFQVLNLAAAGLFIYGEIKAREGKLLRYPVNFRFIK